MTFCLGRGPHACFRAESCFQMSRAAVARSAFGSPRPVRDPQRPRAGLPRAGEMRCPMCRGFKRSNKTHWTGLLSCHRPRRVSAAHPLRVGWAVPTSPLCPAPARSLSTGSAEVRRLGDPSPRHPAASGQSGVEPVAWRRCQHLPCPARPPKGDSPSVWPWHLDSLLPKSTVLSKVCLSAELQLQCPCASEQWDSVGSQRG